MSHSRWLLLADPSQPLEAHQQTLLLLGNLCSDAVDGASVLSKRVLLANGFEAIIFNYLSHRDEFALMFACGVVQNLTNDSEWSTRALHHGVEKQLSKLVTTHTDENVVRYAAGALKNMSVTSFTELSSEARHAIEERSHSVGATLTHACTRTDTQTQRHTHAGPCIHACMHGHPLAGVCPAVPGAPIDATHRTGGPPDGS